MSRSIYPTGTSNHFGSHAWQKLLYQESCIQITQTLKRALSEWLGCRDVFCITMKLIFTKLYFVLLRTCWQHWSSYRLQGYLIRIIWFNRNLRQFQLQKYQNLLWNLPMLLHSVSETEYVGKLKRNLLQIWTAEVCTSISVNIKNCRVHFQLWVFKLCWTNGSQACVPQAVTVNKLTPLRKYPTLCIS